MNLNNLAILNSESESITTSSLPGLGIGTDITIGIITVITIFAVSYARKKIDEHKLEISYHFDAAIAELLVIDKNPNSDALLWVSISETARVMGMVFERGMIWSNGSYYRTLKFTYNNIQQGRTTCPEGIFLVFYSYFHYWMFRYYKPYTFLCNPVLSPIRKDLIRATEGQFRSKIIVIVLPDKPTTMFFYFRLNDILRANGEQPVTFW